MGKVIVAAPLSAADVREFFKVNIVEFDVDGSIFVAGPVDGYQLSHEEILSCVRHLSARRGVAISYRLPVRYIIGRPPRLPHGADVVVNATADIADTAANDGEAMAMVAELRGKSTH